LPEPEGGAILQSMGAENVPALVAHANGCLARGEWQAAREGFDRVRAQAEEPEVLEGLGLAAWWLDDAETVFDARARAYQLYRRRGDRRGAARVAMTIAMDSFHFRGQTSVARGWQRRAARLLDGLPPGPEDAWLRVWDCELSLATGGDAGRVRELAAEAVAMGRVLDDPDAEMMALSLEGLALVTQGAMDEGMRRLDEVATAALAGDMKNPLAIGISCCHLVTACEIVRDFGRAAEWCDRLREYSEHVRWGVLTSVCRTQHAEVLIWNGAWSDAESELQQALQHLSRARPSMREEPLVRLAELRRRQGRLDEAEALLEGVDWHPHRRLVAAAVALDRGKAELAAGHARRFLEDSTPSNRTDRVLAGELLLRAEVALGLTPTTRALEEIQELAAAIGTDPLRASARLAEGLVLAAGGDHERARGAIEDAIGLLARAGARYEVARARLDLARCLLALHRADAARPELERASRAFDELGAVADARRVRALAADARKAPRSAGPHRRPSGLSARELEVLQLVAEGLSNQQIAKRLVVSEFTVKRHVANILTKLDLPTRAAAAASAVREGWV
jgi:ATP/maltotriose-dependent transcriptional regulator MalT